MCRAGEILGYDNIWGGTWRHRTIQVVGIASVALVTTTVPAAYYCKNWFWGIYAFWVIGPPRGFFWSTFSCLEGETNHMRSSSSRPGRM